MTGKAISPPEKAEVSGCSDICDFASELFSFLMTEAPDEATLFEIIGVIEMVKKDFIEVFDND